MFYINALQITIKISSDSRPEKRFLSHLRADPEAGAVECGQEVAAIGRLG
jgi:hypothetical protein